MLINMDRVSVQVFRNSTIIWWSVLHALEGWYLLGESEGITCNW